MTADKVQGILLSSMSTFEILANTVTCAHQVRFAGRGVVGGAV